jgi:hypothetical protein
MLALIHPRTPGAHPKGGLLVHGVTRRRWLAIGLAALLISALPAIASANHSWGGYHWARQSNTFTLKVGDNVSGDWDAVLNTTISDWSRSTVLDLTKVAGGTRVKPCKPTAGRDEVCNASYGNNGWLGLAQIWVTGKHITQGVTKLNDYYMNRAPYNTTAWRNLVSCQEVGHTLGLDHQDENFDNANLGTCMDYTSNPGTNQHPNQGDYDELLCIYDPASAGRTLSTSTHSCTGTGHLDSSTTVGMPVFNGNTLSGSSWGREIRRSARESLFMISDGRGHSLFTLVFWAR